ncbi:MAG: DNA polymerase ligase N-terminal domain-containing protein [Nitrososphaerota archaeon]
MSFTPIFVVHQHFAKRAGLHYDLRIEIEGVLKSWAMRKEPPITKNVKRLCIPQPDHDLSYADFEGEIIQGYGAGIVKIWDKGEYRLEEHVPESKIIVHLDGVKLRGRYILINTPRGWLFFKS